MGKTSPTSEPAIVVQKSYDWTLWVLPKVEKFPRSFRQSIGQPLVTSSIELLLHLVDATYQVRSAVGCVPWPICPATGEEIHFDLMDATVPAWLG